MARAMVSIVLQSSETDIIRISIDSVDGFKMKIDGDGLYPSDLLMVQEIVSAIRKQKDKYHAAIRERGTT